MRKIAWAFAAVMLVGAAPARAEETATEGSGFASPTAPGGGTGFGVVGQFVVSMGATAGEHLFFHKTSGGPWELRLSPALDYFVIPHLSVGGVLSYGHRSGGTGTGTNGTGANDIAVGARVGYNLDLTDRFGFWPMGGLYLDYASANHSSNTNTWLGLYAPFLFHVAPHFFAGLGPSFQVNLSGPNANQYGVDSMIGGWF